jgi:hypothetical protein
MSTSQLETLRHKEGKLKGHELENSYVRVAKHEEVVIVLARIAALQLGTWIVIDIQAT